MRNWVCFMLWAAPLPAMAASAARPVVVELFQSQGCSSCPPANASLMALADHHPEILSLSWHVTYWDYLGWKDSFGSNEATTRQYAYARSLGHDGVFTPQIVVNGRIDGVGADPAELARLVREGDAPTGPDITVKDGQLSIGAGTGPAAILLVRYNPATIQVPILRGENAGATLPHRNVVQELRHLGTWTGQPATYTLPPAPPGLAQAILVQSPNTGPILAAARVAP